MCMQEWDVSGVAGMFKWDVSGVADAFTWDVSGVANAFKRDVSGERAARPNTAQPASERHGQRGVAASERRGQINQARRASERHGQRPRKRRASGVAKIGATGERAARPKRKRRDL